MAIVQITPCVDWFYVAPDVIFRVAAWALYGNGDVVGLVSAGAVTEEKQAMLISPPPIGGTYLHESKLSIEQKLQLQTTS